MYFGDLCVLTDVLIAADSVKRLLIKPKPLTYRTAQFGGSLIQTLRQQPGTVSFAKFP